MTKPGEVRRRRIGITGGAMVVALGMLSLPARDPDVGPEGLPSPFRWDASEMFTALESEFAVPPETTIEDARRRADGIDALVQATVQRFGGAAVP